MDKIPLNKKPIHSIFLLLGLTLISSILFQLLMLLSGSLLFKEVFPPPFDSNMSVSQLNYLKLALLIGSFGTFLIPALWFQRKEKQFQYFPTASIEARPFFLVLIVLFAFVPVMNLIAELNQNMHLPKSWKAVEDWMFKSEQEAEAMMRPIVMDASWVSFLFNILVLAVVPAIVEEYFFRGALQGVLTRWFGNIHWAILITALIFSAIHLQFYGFLPRFLLGLFFGYLLYWSQNIWLPIAAHFINNFTVTLLAFIYAKQGKTYEELQASVDFSTILYIFSALVTGLLISQIYQYFKKRNMEKDWQKIREFHNEIEAEMVKQMLEANGIPAILLNKKDSSYLFGKLELFVNKNYTGQAETLIIEQEENRNRDEN